MADTDRLDDARGRVLRARYAGRINRVIDYIEANLDGDLHLDTLASAAAFSPSRNWSWRLEMEAGEAKIEVRDVPEIQVAYLRHIGPYAGDSALFGRLFEQPFSWAGPRGLVGPGTIVFCLYEDDPCITDPAKLRVDVAVSVPAGTATEGAIGTRTIPAGSYAVGHFEVQAEQFGEAWDAMGRWLPQSGYQGSYGPCFEQYLNDASCDPEAQCVVETCVPVKPL